MPRGGYLTIEATNVVLLQPLTSQQTSIPAGDYVKLTVSDRSTTLDAAAQARIAEPASNAKESGSGTDLGLFTVFGLISRNGGKMQVESTPGAGTTFTIYWPSADTAADVVKTESGSESTIHGKETILLVEDEVIVRDLVRSVLQATGYVVLEAANGEQALRLTNEHHGPIQLLLADVVLPGLSGLEVAERLCSVRQEMHVLYMSGYAQDTIERYGVPVRECVFLQKPFTPTTLLKQVRAALEVTKA
jgi:CheY-like chemotaxis protein